MAFGKKKSKAPKAPAPVAPAMTQVEVRSPLGDAYITRSENGALINEARLSPHSAQLLNDARDELGALTRSLGRSDGDRAASIERASRDLYAREAEAIQKDATVAAEKARSQMARRFGGSLNASFGADQLARLESSRLGALGEARQRSRDVAEGLASQDDASRARRMGLLMDVLNQYNGQAQAAGASGSSLLAAELRRSQDQAESRARLLRDYQDNVAAARTRRRGLLNGLLTTGGAVLGGTIGAFAGNPVLGASLGGAAGRGAATFFD